MGTKDQRGARRTPAPSPTPDRSATDCRSRRSRTATIGGIALGLTAAGLAGMPAQAIDTNPPTGPGNIEVFPKRDMVAVEGYGEYAGKTAQITVTRGSTVIGSARGIVDATGFLEVNHPGGVCWGAGTSLQVTPNIRGGDEIKVEFLGTATTEQPGNRWDGAVTEEVTIDSVRPVTEESQLVITGSFGPDVDMPGADLTVDPGRFGVEIVNPDMRDGTSAVGERAIGWPVEAGEATAGYTVTGGIVAGAEGAGGTFEVTYDFEQASDLDLALAGEVVGLAWQADAPAELGIEAQYGMTLYEFHEAAGPGMGGCPAGPQEMRPDAPSEVTATGAGPGEIHVTWNAGTTVLEAPPITGYSVTAVRPYSDGAHAGGLVRVAESVRSATVRGLTPGEVYSVEVASRSSAGDSAPAVMRVTAAAHTVPTAEATTIRVADADGEYLPLVTNANGDFGVHLDPVEGLVGERIHYTTDGSTPSVQSPTYDPLQSLQIRQDTTVKWIVIDGGNVAGPVGSKFFDIVSSDQPAPEITKVAPGSVSGAVDVTFTQIDDETVGAYRVQAYTGDSVDVATGVRVGSPVGLAQPADLTLDELTRRVPNLVDGTPYRFTVAARYGTVWSDESELSAAVAPEAPASASAGPDQTVQRGRVVSLDGSASAQVTSYEWSQVRPQVTLPDGTPYRDPIVTLSDPTKVNPTFRFPTKTSSTSDDGMLTFRLRTTHTGADGTTFTRGDLVDIHQQPDVVTASEARWRQGRALRMSGTGTQENATLHFHDGSATGRELFTAVVTNGEWAAPEIVVNLSNGRIFVWSEYGYVGTIQTTR